MKSFLLIISLLGNLYLYTREPGTGIPKKQVEPEQTQEVVQNIPSAAELVLPEVSEEAQVSGPTEEEPINPGPVLLEDGSLANAQEAAAITLQNEQSLYFNGCMAGLWHTEPNANADLHIEACNTIRDNFFKKDDNGTTQSQEH